MLRKALSLYSIHLCQDKTDSAPVTCNLDARDINGTVNEFDYDGDLLTAVDADTLDWDLNGNLTDGIITDMEWNWDNRLRSATVGSDNIFCRYAPDGSMVYKKTTVNNEDTERKFIVDIVGKYPVILMELDPASDNEIKKTYIHANGQVLMQHDGDSNEDYFYLHDRLGSVRQMIAPDGMVFEYGGTDNYYTYDPFGNLLESGTTGDTTSRFRFAGYKWDNTTGMYNCNARVQQLDADTGFFKSQITDYFYIPIDVDHDPYRDQIIVTDIGKNSVFLFDLDSYSDLSLVNEPIFVNEISIDGVIDLSGIVVVDDSLQQMLFISDSTYGYYKKCVIYDHYDRDCYGIFEILKHKLRIFNIDGAVTSCIIEASRNEYRDIFNLINDKHDFQAIVNSWGSIIGMSYKVSNGMLVYEFEVGSRIYPVIFSKAVNGVWYISKI